MGALMVGALGVVFGDIGTSPLYALKVAVEASNGVGGASLEPAVTGILSLITWALLLVVAVKYVMIIMRADNHGEGGVFALTALVSRHLGKGNAGVERARPERRCKALGWEVLLNRAGATFRKLPERDTQVGGTFAAATTNGRCVGFVDTSIKFSVTRATKRDRPLAINRVRVGRKASIRTTPFAYR